MLRRPVLLAAAVLVASCATPRPARSPSPLVGRSLDIAAPSLDGGEVRVHAAQGTVRVVDFWASWCEPCREQLPFLDRLASAYGARGLEVYGVSFDEDRAAVERFLAAYPVSFPMLWDKGGKALSDRLQITRLPTTVLVDRGGVVREVHLGFHPREEGRIEESVRRLLDE